MPCFRFRASASLETTFHCVFAGVLLLNAVLPVLLGRKHISPPPDAGEEERAVCLTAKTEAQLSGIILLKIQDKITATGLNCFLVRHFEIEVDFFGLKCNYCSHHIRI